MSGQQRLEQLIGHLADLGARRLAALTIVGLTVFTAITLGSLYLSQPEYETLYVGLAPQDVSRIGAALGEAGISFDVDAEGKKVLVRVGETARARMLLAEKGLPENASAGYELFDKLGSMGLTSFMQNVTRVRALEGEIGRTILAMKGIRAVRVHVVLPDKGSFRRARRAPSASVMIKTDGAGQFASANAIRYLVASAIPDMRIDNVNVLSSDGKLLAVGGDSLTAAPGKMLNLEGELAKAIRRNISSTLLPYLGYENFQVSVMAKLNLDKRQSNETKYDPDSKVERSVRTMKETGNSKNTRSTTAVGVEENIPEEENASGAGDRSQQAKVRREELKNYELNSKITSTVSQGYRIEKLAIAVVVNRKRLQAALGPNANAGDIDRQLQELKRLVTTAAGIDLGRGDKVAVSAVEFIQTGSLATADTPPGLMEQLSKHTAAFLKVLTIIVVAFLLIWFGLRPVTRLLLEPPVQKDAVEGGALGADAQNPNQSLAASQAGNVATAALAPAALGAGALPIESSAQGNLLPDIQANGTSTHMARLEQMVDVDTQQAAATFKQWVREEAVQ